MWTMKAIILKITVCWMVHELIKTMLTSMSRLKRALTYTEQRDLFFNLETLFQINDSIHQDLPPSALYTKVE